MNLTRSSSTIDTRDERGGTGGEKNETLSKSRREGTGTGTVLFHPRTIVSRRLSANERESAAISQRTQGEINRPVLILTDSTAK